MNTLLTKNIWAIGRNYIEHAKEMHADLPSEPLVFLKAGSCLEIDSKISLPKWSNDVQHEIEIALWIDESLNYSHISLALDLTARDAQSKAKAKGLPWTLAKSFTAACPLGPWVSLAEFSSLSPDALSFDDFSFELTINQNGVQKASARDMIFSPQRLLEHIKAYFPLAPHDVILTGTPSGVSTLHSGDQLDATLWHENRKILSCHWDIV